MRALPALALLLAAWLAVASALSCLPCTKDRHVKCLLDNPSECSCFPWGRKPGVCGCGCMVCARGLGQSCGGPWNLSGQCGDGMVCDKRPPLAGKCVKACSDPVIKYFPIKKLPKAVAEPEVLKRTENA
ncbi:venom protein 302-like [Amphibalanus amphitrite]|uniref:venom protein 302-like n=1 Tax=Amphibalanus amphitrite TaxID=1232801 RepID=UPI001C926C44|nr:venom protein 302-like [Amphibalanus amphitrite]